MREFAVRAHLLRAALGDRSALDSAAILVAEVENPALRGRIQEKARRGRRLITRSVTRRACRVLVDHNAVRTTRAGRLEER